MSENKIRNKGMEYIVAGPWKNMMELGLRNIVIIQVRVISIKMESELSQKLVIIISKLLIWDRTESEKGELRLLLRQNGLTCILLT